MTSCSGAKGGSAPPVSCFFHLQALKPATWRLDVFLPSYWWSMSVCIRGDVQPHVTNCTGDRTTVFCTMNFTPFFCAVFSSSSSFSSILYGRYSEIPPVAPSSAAPRLQTISVRSAHKHAVLKSNILPAGVALFWLRGAPSCCALWCAATPPPSQPTLLLHRKQPCPPARLDHQCRT